MHRFPACDPPEAAARQNTRRAEAGERCVHIFKTTENGF